MKKGADESETLHSFSTFFLVLEQLDFLNSFILRLLLYTLDIKKILLMASLFILFENVKYKV